MLNVWPTVVRYGTKIKAIASLDKLPFELTEDGIARSKFRESFILCSRVVLLLQTFRRG